jgi:Right handed beta helix region
MIGLLAAAALAASVTVNPGDDLNALTSSLLPGDVVSFNAGTYSLYGTVYWTGIGTEDAPIVFKPSGNGEVILQNTQGGWVVQVNESAYIEVRGLTLEGGGDIAYTQPSGLYVSNSANLTLRDLVIRNVWGDAMRLDGNTSNLSVRNNELSSTEGSGISIGCWNASCWMQDSVVEFNLIHDVGSDGLYLLPGTQSSTFQHNVLFNIGGTGIEQYSTVFGPQNVLLGNAMWQVEGNGIYLEGAALVQNNVIFDVGDEGIEVRAGYNDTLYDIQISHNTVALTQGWAAYLDDWYFAEGLVFANNVLANPIGYGLYWDDLRQNDYYAYGYDPNYADTLNYISNNVVTGLVDGFQLVQRPTFALLGGGIGDFEDPDNFDFYPTFTSQLRNAGDPNGNAYIPDADFNGTARDGASPDVGAYEYDGEGNPGWVLQEGFKDYDLTEGRDRSSISGGCCGDGGNDATAAVIVLPFALLAGWRRRRD